MRPAGSALDEGANMSYSKAVAYASGVASAGIVPVPPEGRCKPYPAMTNAASLSVFFAWLEERAQDVRRIEQQALRDLERKDVQSYRDGMRRKAELLAGLPKASIPLISGLPEDAAQGIGEGLWRFARNAGNALSLGSVFYMSALLYPAEYREGEPNDLEVFLEELRARFPN